MLLFHWFLFGLLVPNVVISFDMLQNTTPGTGPEVPPYSQNTITVKVSFPGKWITATNCNMGGIMAHGRIDLPGGRWPTKTQFDIPGNLVWCI